MNQQRFVSFLLISVAIVAALAACTTEDEPTQTPLATPAPTEVPPTAAPAPTIPTDTPVPTAQPAPDETPLSTPTTAPTPTPRPDDDKTLTLLYWQAPTLPFAYRSSGSKDLDASAIALEPLAAIDPEGDIIPVLAVDIPTVENGGVSADGLTVTWRLRENVQWSDGSDLTADDVVFTWKYCANEATGCFSVRTFQNFESVTANGSHEVVFNLRLPSRNPGRALAGFSTPIISRAQFADCFPDNVAACDEHYLKPLGTGPYAVVQTRPNDSITYERNPHWWGGLPYFDRVHMIGGGDAESAAQAVLLDGDAEYAWNVQVPPADLNTWTAVGNGQLVTGFASSVERIIVNQTNPHTADEENRSEYLDGMNPHPFLTFTPIRQAMSMAIDRQRIVDELYGAAGAPTCNLVPAPARFVSDQGDDCLVQDIEGAKALLDANGVIDSDGDGIREFNDTPLEITFQTSENAVREGTFALLNGWWEEIGISSSLITHDAGIFFGANPADSTATYNRFFADVQMFTFGSGLDPQSYLSSYECADIPTRDNLWTGGNTSRMCNETYDSIVAMLRFTETEEERVDILRALDDALVRTAYEIPLVFRGFVSAHATSLMGVRMNSWDAELWNIGEWYLRAGS